MAVRQAGRANPGVVLPTYGPPPPPPPTPYETPSNPIDNTAGCGGGAPADLPAASPRIFGFLKVRDEILREGNLYRALDTLRRVCDGGVLFDDQSNDGTWEALQRFAAEESKRGRYWHLMRARDEERSFAREMIAKQRMMGCLHAFKEKPEWIVWLDGDESIQDPEDFRAWLLEQKTAAAFRLHYTQLWQNEAWARTDDGFDDGAYIKAWRYRPDFSFDCREGTHNAQFPLQVDPRGAELAPFECYHWGNYGKNMQWKAHAYAGGLGGIDRHIFWGHDGPSMAPCVGYDIPYIAPRPTFRPSLLTEENGLPARLPSGEGSGRGAAAHAPPKALPLETVQRIRAMGGLKGLPGWFTVVIPTFNRADTLPKALESLRAQTWTNWLAVVLDDGSSDATPRVMREWQDRDPRIFYARYPENRGGVAMNEHGMALACEWSEWWTRLGSDDYWGPGKLAADAVALQAGAKAVWGPFHVVRFGRACERCAEAPQDANALLLSGRFAAGWACAAVATSALREVRARFGNFCDPRLRNMEDFLVNARVALFATWRWRPGDPLDAAWNCLQDVGADASASASANAAQTAQDEALTRQLIREMLP